MSKKLKNQTSCQTSRKNQQKNVINIKPIQRRAIDIVKIIEVFKLKIEFFSTLFGLLLMILKLN